MYIMLFLFLLIIWKSVFLFGKIWYIFSAVCLLFIPGFVDLFIWPTFLGLISIEARLVTRVLIVFYFIIFLLFLYIYSETRFSFNFN